MGILEAAQPAVIICTRNRAGATAFYRDLGWRWPTNTVSPQFSRPAESRCAYLLWPISHRMNIPFSDSTCRMCQ